MSTTNWPRTDSEISFTGAYTCTHHNDQMRAVCPVCRVTALTAERDQLRAEVERLKTCGIVELAAINSSVLEYCKHWEARAELAEDNLATLEQCHDDNCRSVVKIAAELATAKELLRSEAMDDYAAVKVVRRELAAERARLDWLDDHLDYELVITVFGETIGLASDGGPRELRAAIDAAMREDRK